MQLDNCPIQETMSDYPGLFITLEGIEGCGKSTQIKMLGDYLQNRGFSVILTKEPGGTLLGKNIRNLLLRSQGINIGSEAELFLFAADRSQHVKEIILPGLKDGKVVICDRFTDATVAYQGYARGVDNALIDKLNNLATSGLKPDVTILLEMEVSTGLERARSRNQKKDSLKREDRFEREGNSFHDKVKQGYLALAQAEPDRIKLINADRTIKQVHDDILQRVLPLLNKRG